MAIVAENLKGLELTSANVEGFADFCRLMARASATGHLFYKHDFDNAADISVDLRGIGSISAPRFVTVNVGNHLTLEFNDPSDTNVFFNELIAAGVVEQESARLSANYVVVNPDKLDLEVASRALNTTLSQSAALAKVIPKYDDIATFVRDLITAEHAFRDEYTIDYTYDRIIAAITEENFEVVVATLCIHSPSADDPTEMAFDLLLICSALVEQRGYFFPSISEVLERALPDIIGDEDVIDAKELLDTLREMQVTVG